MHKALACNSEADSVLPSWSLVSPGRDKQINRPFDVVIKAVMGLRDIVLT